jgi:hypothetical protein
MIKLILILICHWLLSTSPAVELAIISLLLAAADETTYTPTFSSGLFLLNWLQGQSLLLYS